MWNLTTNAELYNRYDITTYGNHNYDDSVGVRIVGYLFFFIGTFIVLFIPTLRRFLGFIIAMIFSSIRYLFTYRDLILRKSDQKGDYYLFIIANTAQLIAFIFLIFAIPSNLGSYAIPTTLILLLIYFGVSFLIIPRIMYNKIFREEIHLLNQSKSWPSIMGVVTKSA